MTVLYGINLASDTGLQPFMVESDALGVVNLVNAGSPSLADIGIVIGDIFTRLKEVAHGSTAFAPKKANYVVHTLSKLALKSDRDQIWMEDYPPCVERFLLEDYSGLCV
ncbi:hypothetical protein Ddye_029955 [Dipteronia dyeriana]|uniref:RNase H type-1 domain-containing protein n=1 Tax=Dipteronia dyeriana TaxID=168575 RepID=A0AAD9WM96_9ROSI|nr:hypothetical protein Ddye_029955 [Dipteronia dyeriana]